MSDQTIRFKIASTFAGEGFTQLNKGVQGMANSANNAVSAGQKITGALSSVEGMTGKVAKGCADVISSFKSLGVAGGVATIAVEGVKLWFDRALESAKKLRDKVIDLGAAMKQKLGETVNGILGDMKQSLDAVGKKADADASSLDKVADAARRVNDAMGKTESAKGAADAVNVKLETLNKKLAAENKNAADLAEAEGDVKLAQVEKANVVREHARIVEAAKTAEETAQQKLETAQTKLTNARETLKSLMEEEQLLIDSGLDDQSALNQARSEVEKAEALVRTREDQLTTATADVTVRHQELETALINQKTAVDLHDGAIKDAVSSLDKLKEKQANEAQAAETEAKIKVQLSAAEASYKEQQEHLAVTIESAENRRQAALEALADAHANYEKREAEAAATTKDKYTKLQQINLDKLSEAFDKAPKSLSNVQKQMVADYREWLALQGDNPWKDVINKVTNDIEALDSETRANVAAINENMTGTANEITALKETLADCLRLK